MEGTTGYDYMNFANRLFVDEAQSGCELKSLFKVDRPDQSIEISLYNKKKLVMRTLLGVEMRALGASWPSWLVTTATRANYIRRNWPRR